MRSTSFIPPSWRRALIALTMGAAAGAAWAQTALSAPIADAAALAPSLGGPVAGDPGTLALDTTSQTTDHSINTPTGWWAYGGVSAAQVGTFLTNNSARLTEIQVQSVSGGVPTFSVRMVRNSGAYAAPGGWWWYFGLTAAQVTSYLNANQARLIDIEPYDIGGGTIRFAVIMVANTGTAARSWWWYQGVTPSQIGSYLTANNARLVDLDSYVVGGQRRFTAVMVSNTGADAKAWQWWHGQNFADIGPKVTAFNGRIVKIDRNSDGTYNFVQVRNTGSDNSAWWHAYGFSSMGALVNHANQLAARPVSIHTYLNSLGQRRWDAAFIDNANAATRRMRGVYGQTFLDANGYPTRGIFAAYLKQVGGSELVTLNHSRQAETASALKSLHLLHSMKQVELGNTTLNSAFVYYDYPDGSSQTASNKCPDPVYEVPANLRTNYSFETGLDEMMRISDNRTTRGVVLRYGMAAINASGTSAGLNSTQIRHNIGCAYRNTTTGKYDPANLRNNTTARDLARIYEVARQGTWLTNRNNAQDEFFESVNRFTGAGEMAAIINAEAAALGKSAIVSSFSSQIRHWNKGGSYGTCLPDASGGCGQRVIIRSTTGLLQLPFKSAGVIAPRNYAYAHFISDVPVSCFENTSTTAVDCPSDTHYTNAFAAARPELFREVIRAALQTW